MRKSRCTSWAESEAVGSSMIRTRTSSEIALAISTVCCSARVSPRAGSPTSSRTSSRAEDLARLAFHAPPVDDLAAIAVADEDVLGDRQVREDHRLLVDGRDAEALRVLGGGDADRRAIDADLAGVLLLDAGHDLDQGRFAGPVLAQQRVDLATRSSRETSSSASVAPNCFETCSISRTGRSSPGATTASSSDRSTAG